MSSIESQPKKVVVVVVEVVVVVVIVLVLVCVFVVGFGFISVVVLNVGHRNLTLKFGQNWGCCGCCC